MTAPFLIGTGTVPEDIALRLRGAQTDLYGEVMGGDRGLYDFGLPTAIDLPAVNETIPNLILDKEGGSLSFAPTSVRAAKGVKFTPNGGKRFTVGDTFNPGAMGVRPSFAISAWITGDGEAAHLSGVAGAVDANNAAGIGWRWMVVNANIQMTLSNGLTTTASVNVPGLENGVPHLFTMECRKTGANSYSLRGYRDGVLGQTVAGAYPILNPNTKACFGFTTGSSGSTVMTLHRAMSRKFDPDHFDIAAWHKEEIDANKGRWG